MKKYFFLYLSICLPAFCMAQQNVGIGTTNPNGNALLHVDLGNSTTKGVLVTGTYDPTSIVPDLGAGSRMMFYPGKSAFRAGYVDGIQWDNANVGLFSIAMGSRTIANAPYSTALGRLTTANGAYSTALGYNTNATGDYGIAMGNSGTASGNTSTALGNGTTASGSYSIAMGYDSYAGGYTSTALGRYSIAKGYAS